MHTITRRGPDFVVLYRWRLHPGKEEQFVQAWSRISERLLVDRGSLGSRLHRGDDGLWYGYAQWPSSEARANAFAQISVDADAGARMRDAITENLPEIILESISDYLISPPENSDSPSNHPSCPLPQ